MKPKNSKPKPIILDNNPLSLLKSLLLGLMLGLLLGLLGLLLGLLGLLGLLLGLLSLLGLLLYAEEYPENFKELCKAGENSNSPQEIKEKSNRRKTRDIWKSINELLGIDWNGDDIISDCHRQKELIKLEIAIKKKLNLGLGEGENDK